MEQIQEIANQNGTPNLQICPIFKNLGNLVLTSSKPKYEKRKKIGSKGKRNLVLNPGHNNIGMMNVAKNRLTKISFLGGFVKKQNIPRSTAVGPHSQRRKPKTSTKPLGNFVHTLVHLKRPTRHRASRKYHLLNQLNSISLIHHPSK